MIHASVAIIFMVLSSIYFVLWSCIVRCWITSYFWRWKLTGKRESESECLRACFVAYYLKVRWYGILCTYVCMVGFHFQWAGLENCHHLVRFCHGKKRGRYNLTRTPGFYSTVKKKENEKVYLVVYGYSVRLEVLEWCIVAEERVSRVGNWSCGALGGKKVGSCGDRVWNGRKVVLFAVIVMRVILEHFIVW